MAVCYYCFDLKVKKYCQSLSLSVWIANLCSVGGGVGGRAVALNWIWGDFRFGGVNS
jgi:hypothetical protein